jgi:indolepyruvate ferredoxin oxidoreductase
VVGLDADKLDLAVEILGLAESIKGYGPIKERSVAEYKQRLSKLLLSWEASTPSQPKSREPARATAA